MVPPLRRLFIWQLLSLLVLLAQAVCPNVRSRNLQQGMSMGGSGGAGMGGGHGGMMGDDNDGGGSGNSDGYGMGGSGSGWGEERNHSEGWGHTGTCGNATAWGWEDSENYGGGMGGEGGMGGGDQASAIIHRLFENHLLIDREVTHNDDGTIQTKTTSNDPSVAALLQTHVQMMHSRLKDHRIIRQCDPFFVELFDHYDEYSGLTTNVTDGVNVLLSASTTCGQALIEGHTNVVTKFVETGMAEAMKMHAAPQVCTNETAYSEGPTPRSSVAPVVNSQSTISAASTTATSAAHSNHNTGTFLGLAGLAYAFLASG